MGFQKLSSERLVGCNLFIGIQHLRRSILKGIAVQRHLLGLRVLWEKRGFPRGEHLPSDLRGHLVLLGVRVPRSLVGNPGFVVGLLEGCEGFVSPHRLALVGLRGLEVLLQSSLLWIFVSLGSGSVSPLNHRASHDNWEDVVTRDVPKHCSST